MRNMKFEILVFNYGGIITSIKTPDKNSKFDNVVLGFEKLEDYTKFHPYFGAIVGRYANRIGGAQFMLDDQSYTLAANNDENSLHGGIEGFDKKLWTAYEFEDDNGPRLELEYISPDGEEGYPGTMTCKVVYSLSNENELRIEYFATTDRKTVLNLTNHSYFNLKDAGRSNILDHRISIKSDLITPTDEQSIPTGEFMDVEGTPFDFRESHTIGERIESDHPQTVFGKGYDHNYVLGENGEMKLAATVHEPESGRVMEVYTTEPGVQFYTGNFLGTAPEGVEPPNFEHRTGFCLETQHFPDSPNRPEFPSVLLDPGEVFVSVTIYKFSVEN
jgi:aldose 1-epimerase